MDTHTNSIWLVVILIMMTLTSCTVTITTHSFEMVPNTPIGTDGQFFYVKYGVIGTSSAYYSKYKGGGNVRNGLVADAKANLRNQHLLSPNQAYSNMSVDVLQTKAGVNTPQGFSTNSISITVVVEADIIEYGLPPVNHQPIVQSAGLIPNDTNAPTGLRPTDNSAPSGLPPTDTGVPNEITNNKTTQTEYSIGETVIYTKSNKSYDAIIIGVGEYNYINSRKIEYINESGSTKKRWVYVESLSKK